MVSHLFNTIRSIPQQVLKRYFLSAMPSFLLLLLTAVVLFWFVQFETESFYMNQKDLATGAVKGARQNLSYRVEQQQQSVEALIQHERALLLDIIATPVDEEKLALLEFAIQNRFPEYFRYILTDSSGRTLLQGRDVILGPNCMSSIRQFAENPEKHKETLLIHGKNIDGYHIDMMAYIDNGADSAIFFVSFKVEQLVKLLQNSQIQGQSLLLVKGTDHKQIELSARGAFNSSWHGSRLTEPMLASVLHQETVPGTGWSLLSLPNSDIFSQYRSSLVQRAVIGFVALLVLVILFHRRLWIEETSRLVAEQNLQHINEQLELKVTERTRKIKQSEEDLQKTFMSVPFGMLVVNRQGKIELINKRAEEIFGYDDNELLQQPIDILLPERDRKQHAIHVEKYNKQTRMMGHGRLLTGLRKNGEEFSIEVGLSHLEHSTGYKTIASISDVSELVSAQQKLMEEHERATVTLSSIGDGVITTDVDAGVLSMNPVAEKLSGWTSVDAVGKHITEVFKVINEQTREKVADPVVRCLDSKSIVELDTDTVLIHKNGMDIPIEDSAAPIHSADGFIIGAVLVFHDVTQSRQHSNEIQYQANHDALTGLTNRREFDVRLTNSVAQARETNSENVLLFMDLDRFKLVNDTAGHAAGDELLKQLANLLSAKLRQRDTFARLGGDEFGVLLEHCSRDVGMRLANKLQTAIEGFRFFWEGRAFNVGVSIGLVPFSGLAKSADELLSEADAACYSAKESGRNRVQIYDEKAARTRSENSIVNTLNDAFENNRMQLYQQKIMATDKTQKTVHYEVLVRMLSEQGEVIPPGMFLPAAERFGLATTLDRWVIRKSCHWLEQHQSKFSCPLVLAINLSGQSITDRLFADFVKDQFAEFQIAKGSISFEITETAVMNNLETAQQFIEEISLLGCQFALDDFGSGHASYAHLKYLPVDFLKIDGLFVKDILQDKIDFAIVRSVNEVGHVLGMKTIAEFVESEGIIEKLSEIGVDFLQGYAISRPAPIDEILVQFNRHRVISPHS